MSVNELRKDYILDRWVVIASQRKRRPTDFVKAKEERQPSTCPFCPGSEHLTPPASLVYLRDENNRIKKDQDKDGFRHKNWIIRCFPNLYPAFSPPKTGTADNSGKSDFVSVEALGHHEVLIESPEHNEHPSVAKVSQLTHVIHAYVDRFKTFSSHDYVKYVSIFRNQGAEAGASLSHAHTQIAAMPMIPTIVEGELVKSREYFEENKKCVFCRILEEERNSERFIWENGSFTVFAPWAGVHPFEFWVFPKRHQSTILDMTENEIESLAMAIRVCFGGLRTLLNDPPYNLGFHMTPDKCYHWHIEVYPKLAIWGGLEKSTGVFINVMSPEEAAASLRDIFKKEEEAVQEI